MGVLGMLGARVVEEEEAPQPPGAVMVDRDWLKVGVRRVSATRAVLRAMAMLRGLV
jgi:hypothetical protein